MGRDVRHCGRREQEGRGVANRQLSRTAGGQCQDIVHGKNDFVVTDSEFAFGWHFYVISINKELIQKLADQMGPDFEKLKGKGLDKKFLTWLTNKMHQKNLRIKFAIKEEMESSKFGIF